MEARKEKSLGILLCGAAVLTWALLACGSDPSPPSELQNTDATDPSDEGGSKAMVPGFGGDSGAAVAAASCKAGETRPCTPTAAPADAGADAGLCTPGIETCTLTGHGEVGEVTSWGACAGAVFAVPRGRYSLKHSGAASGSTPPICCDPGDTIVSVVDCGDGHNHSAEQQGKCGVGHEGPGNQGSACVEITCEGSGLDCPVDGGTPK